MKIEIKIENLIGTVEVNANNASVGEIFDNILCEVLKAATRLQNDTRTAGAQHTAKEKRAERVVDYFESLRYDFPKPNKKWLTRDTQPGNNQPRRPTTKTNHNNREVFADNEKGLPYFEREPSHQKPRATTHGASSGRNHIEVQDMPDGCVQIQIRPISSSTQPQGGANHSRNFYERF